MSSILFLADQGSVLGGIFAGGMGLLFLAVAIIASVFWIWMLIDCITSSLPPVEKLIWALVILFLHVIGALLYYVIARGGSRRSMV